MPKIIKYPLAALGAIVIIVAVNIALGAFYFNSYREEVSKIITSYIEDVTGGVITTQHITILVKK